MVVISKLLNFRDVSVIFVAFVDDSPKFEPADGEQFCPAKRARSVPPLCPRAGRCDRCDRKPRLDGPGGRLTSAHRFRAREGLSSLQRVE